MLWGRNVPTDFWWKAFISLMTLFLFSAQDSGGPAWLRAHSGVLRCFPCSRCDQWKRGFCLGKRRQWYSKQTSFYFLLFGVCLCGLWQLHLNTELNGWVSVWKVASGSAPRTPITLHSKCVYLATLKPRGWCVELTAPWLLATSTALWHVEATGDYSGSWFKSVTKMRKWWAALYNAETTFSLHVFRKKC